MSAAKKKLLIVDDDENLRELFTFSMQREGFEVGQAVDGADGLQKIESFKPDVVVCDLMMPNINGFMLIGRLHSQGVRVPIVVLTGFWEQANEAMLREDPNVVEFLRKPVKYAELAEVARKILKGELGGEAKYPKKA